VGVGGINRTPLSEDMVKGAGLENKTYEELKELGIYRNKTRDAETDDVVSKYIKLDSSGENTSVKEAFESVEGTSFSDKAKVFVDILIDKAGDFFKEAGVLNVKLEED